MLTVHRNRDSSDQNSSATAAKAIIIKSTEVIVISAAADVCIALQVVEGTTNFLRADAFVATWPKENDARGNQGGLPS